MVLEGRIWRLRALRFLHKIAALKTGFWLQAQASNDSKFCNHKIFDTKMCQPPIFTKKISESLKFLHASGFTHDHEESKSS